MNVSGLTAARAGLVNCHDCSLLCRVPAHAEPTALRCPRCGAHLHLRRRNSIGRSWALVIAAAILYIPANLLPIMQTGALGHHQADTILSGVIYFLQTGAWHLALVIFTASVVIPLAKIGVLIHLLISVQRRSTRNCRERTRLYRIIEFVGPWSMVDVFVVAILVALVQFEGLASIEPGPGAVAFASVVVITMFAATSFDPRLIWDAAEDGHD